MKAVVFHDVGDIRLEDVPEPKIEQPTDAIVRLTASAICGTDLHFIRGTFPVIELVRTGSFDPASVLTQQEPITSVIDAYKAFDTRQPGWIKVELLPRAGGNRPS